MANIWHCWLQDIDWETVIVDEAHRLKNTGAASRVAVQNLNIQWLLLLTGTLQPS